MIANEGCETRVMEAVRLGASGYVRKPFAAEQIKKLLSLIRVDGSSLSPPCRGFQDRVPRTVTQKRPSAHSRTNRSKTPAPTMRRQ
jgi:DNA-binding NarL/FixJ family response regulator